MKKRLVLFAFACTACLALTTCENQQVIGILRSPSELNFLDVVAYADEYPITGGATLEPSLRPGVFEYTVYVSIDANRIKVEASIGAAGTVEAYSVEDQMTGTEFDYVGNEPKIIILTVQRQYMDLGEYRLTIQRVDTVPPAEDVKITVDPGIAAFFIGSGTIPVFEVTANLPAAGGELSYQWYVNTENNTRDGFPITGADGSTYTMQSGETLTVRTIYYYVEITNTIDGRTGVTVSPTRSVTFLNKYEMDDKSLAMVNIPAGEVKPDFENNWGEYWFNENTSYPDDTIYSRDWSTPGFSMGQYLVTWELWETVRYWADSANYRFSCVGNQGGAYRDYNTTNLEPRPIGNILHPVTLVSWRDVVVWCNAYSEMDGKDPVYRDSNGEPLRDSRLAIELLVDRAKTTGKNGYRLPTPEEWMYAAKGAQPSNTSPWTDKWPGTDVVLEMPYYFWAHSPELAGNGGIKQTGEVGSLRPNSIGLYDMTGMVRHWVWWIEIQYPSQQKEVGYVGLDFAQNIAGSNFHYFDMFGRAGHETFRYNDDFTGFRLVQGGN